MNKNAIKKFAIDARNKLIASVTDKAGMLGITPDNCSEAITKGADFEVYRTAAGTEVTLNKKQCEQRRKLVDQIQARGFEAVVEEVAYTWFNRICAIRFMEVNDYMYPVRVRVLSSEKEGKNEPDVVTMAPDIDWDFTDKEREEIIDAKMNNRLDDLFRMLFIKQCNLLHEVLPGLFEETEDYTEMLLNISFTNEDDVIRMLIDSVDEADFNVSTLDENGNPTGQVEIIGWLYQYYNTELKDDTFAKLKKNVKITKERIPAATQLFTPDWIVRYMVENSVGRIWIEHLRANDPSVDEKATAERFGWKYYLPEAEQEADVNVKLAEIRTTYKNLKPIDITCIDPCMGSGHILIAMFDVLMDIYESTGYDKREAAFDIVEHNIHGLDIDKRAYQLAYFAVMMKGRGYNRRFFRGRDDVKPAPKVYAIMESNDIEKNHLQFFGTSMPETERTKAEKQIKYLLQTFVDAREYGSILNVDVCDWELLDRFVNDLNDNGQVTFESLGSEETHEKLQGLIKIAKVMSKKYDAVVINPPYMGASGMISTMIEFIKQNYNNGKSDLFSVFMLKVARMLKNNGYASMMTSYTWMYLTSFSKLRDEMLENTTFTSLIQPEYHAFFDEAYVPICTFTFKKNVTNEMGTFLNLSEYYGADLQPKKVLEAISENLNKDYVYFTCTEKLKMIPNSPLAYWASDNTLRAFTECNSLGEISEVKKGMSTANDDVFLKLWFEINYYNSNLTKKCSNCKWYSITKGGEFRRWYGNNQYVVDWKNDGYNLKNYNKAVIRNKQYYFKPFSLTWTYITSYKLNFRYNTLDFFTAAGPCVFTSQPYTLLALLNSVVAQYFVNMLGGTTITYEIGEVSKIPIIKVQNNKIIDELVLMNIELSKSDWDSFENSWDFIRHPLAPPVSLKQDQMVSKFAQSRMEKFDLISWHYENWKNQCEKRFNQLKANEEELNRIFIDIYGLQDELTPEVEDKDVTVRKAGLQRDIRSFMSYAVGCMFGRYSLDVDGLAFAGGEWNDCKYTSFIPDVDNIIPITDEEYFSDDIVGRFVEFVKIVYGEDTLEENLDFIAQALGNKGDTSREVIRNYFIKDFYADHLKVYQKRPIYWLFDSGKQNGFKALVYMHRYDADTVGRVRTDYLHKAQKYVETVMQSAQYTLDNASSSSEKSKATKSITKYTKQLAEMQIYDEAIAHIANQRIEIDLDDGVKVNYAKFLGVEVAQEGKKALKVDLLAKI